MKILRIIYDFADKNVAAKGLGPGPYELSVAQGNRKDYEVFVLTGNLNGKNLKEFRFHYDLCNGKVHVYNLPRALWKFGPFLTSSVLVLPYYLFLKIFKHIDVVHNQQQMGVWFLLYKKVFGRLEFDNYWRLRQSYRCESYRLSGFSPNIFVYGGIYLLHYRL